jgi:hypothetical protein
MLQEMDEGTIEGVMDGWMQAMDQRAIEGAMDSASDR